MFAHQTLVSVLSVLSLSLFVFMEAEQNRTHKQQQQQHTGNNTRFLSR